MSSPLEEVPLNILLFTRSLERGGAEVQLVMLAQALTRLGHDVLVLTYYDRGELRETLAGTGVRVESLGKRHRWDVVGFFRRFLRRVHSYHPDVIYSFLNGPNVVAALLKPWLRGVPLVWGVRASFVDLESYGWLMRVVWQFETLLSRFPELIICNSRAGRETCLDRGFPEARVIVIPNGVDVQRYRRSQDDRRRLRADWGIPETSVLIGLVGRRDPMKGVETFLAAAESASAEDPRLRFVCVGQGMTSLQTASPHVSFLESRADLPAVYSALDLLCSSSVGEGFSNVIAEAMACEVPCVVTDVGDSRWIVGDTGLVVPSRDIEALSAGLVEMSRRNLTLWGSRARTRVEKQFRIERMAEATDATLRQVAGRARSG